MACKAFELTKSHDDLKRGWGLFGGPFPGRVFAVSPFPDCGTQLEVGMEFMPAVRAAHEHSPDICGDTKRLMTSLAIFDDIIFHRYCIGRGPAPI